MFQTASSKVEFQSRNIRKTEFLRVSISSLPYYLFTQASFKVRVQGRPLYWSRLGLSPHDYLHPHLSFPPASRGICGGQYIILCHHTYTNPAFTSWKDRIMGGIIYWMKLNKKWRANNTLAGVKQM